MSARLTYCLVLAAACGLPRALLAQAMPWNRGTGYQSLEVPASHANGPHDPIGATSYPNWNSAPYSGQGQWAADTVDGDVYGGGQPGHLGFPDTYGLPPNTQGPYGPGGGGVGYAPEWSPQYQFAPSGSAPNGSPSTETIYEMLPQDRGVLYDEDIAALVAAKDRFRGSWFRVDYLNWDMRNPGNTLLGAPLANLEDPRQPFLVTTIDANGNLQTVGQARVPDMTSVDLQHMQGARISFGLPTKRGEFEGVFWGIEAVSRYTAPELVLADPLNIRVPQSNLAVSIDTRFLDFTNERQNPNAVFVATSLLDNDDPSNLLVLYDADYRFKYNIKTWGSEANLLHDLRDPVDGWMLRSLVGFRYTNHSEELIQHGAFDNRSSLDQPIPIIQPTLLFPDRPNVLDEPLVNTISSRTKNDFFAGQIGFKTEWANRWIAVGATPKLALGANSYVATVETRDLRDSPAIFDPLNPGGPSVLRNPQDDGIVLTQVRKTHWAPAFDLGLHARVNLTEWASLHVGYNLIWMHNIARADNIIYYNDTGLTNAPGVVVQHSREDLWTKGITIGGEILLPK